LVFLCLSFDSLLTSRAAQTLFSYRVRDAIGLHVKSILLYDSSDFDGAQNEAPTFASLLGKRRVLKAKTATKKLINGTQTEL